MRFGLVILPQYEWPEAGRLWRQAEELGFDHAWTYDHLSWRGLAGERWHATVPTLTAAATVTERIRLGTFVASPNYRHPVPFAKDVATLDQVSGGRLILGLGSGGTGFDAHVLGQSELSVRERYERFREFTEALDRLLRFERGAGEGISYWGDHFSAVAARMVGEPAQEPRMPFLMAANGPRAMRLAARYGSGWVTTGGDVDTDAAWWARIAELASRLDDALAAEERAPDEFDRVLSLDGDARYSMASADAFEDAVGRARELGFTDVVSHRPREHGLYAGSEAVLEEVGSRLASLR
ncbi:LLM class flavin-dependent oxidoreductase [Agromyces binzhouensis]|uniref:LLM class flavin-dependent oxidoreductase n=1 Tax=Agromyces binzhouensis TaxID=1817495 RepID=A0A4Q2JVB7_9MICO|nr:LLM class flavin-dependent oxidoreductase [Agromyces binzhouensis]RXZ50118.1 LLM class flavin-dependent oxidoreductase [Agromyces binzhouensis]